MKYVAIVLACLFAGALAQIQCPPPDPHANATFFADPEDCHSYYECDNGLPVHVTCPDGLVWNQDIQACDFEFNHPCLTETTTPPPPTEAPFKAQELPTCPPPDPTGQRNVTFFPDETDCHKYYECDNGKLINGTCPDGLVWNADKNVCDFEWAYPCNTRRQVPVKVAEFTEREEIVCPPPNPDGNYNATYYPDETDCHKYHECDNGILKNLTCPDGLVWSQELLACDFEWNTPCNTERRSHVSPAVPIRRIAGFEAEKTFKINQGMRTMKRLRRYFKNFLNKFHQ